MSQVTVYEKRSLPGGLNTTGVAPYKMHAERALAEVGFLRSLGVEIRTGIEVGRDVAAADLLRDHDAVFLGPGLGGDSSLGVPGETGPGVHGAVDWIEHMKLDPACVLADVQRAVVVGGGNTAVDAARELARLGVPTVRMLYRRSAANMSGYLHEMEHGRLEGVVLVEQAVPVAFERGPSGKLLAVTLADGRREPCDLAVVAIGQAKLAELARAFPGVEVNGGGAIVADPVSGATGHPRVFAGGDAMRGGDLVVTAAQDGKRAARAIAAALGLALREDAPMRAGHA